MTFSIETDFNKSIKQLALHRSRMLELLELLVLELQLRWRLQYRHLQCCRRSCSQKQEPKRQLLHIRMLAQVLLHNRKLELELVLHNRKLELVLVLHNRKLELVLLRIRS